MSNKTLSFKGDIKGLHCQSCVSNVENKLTEVDEILSVSVNLILEKIQIEYLETISIYEIKKIVDDLGFNLVIKEESKSLVLYYTLGGLHCQSCVSKVENTLGKIEGIDKVEVNLLNKTLLVTSNSSSDINSLVIDGVEKLGFKIHTKDNSTTNSKDSSVDDKKIRKTFTSTLLFGLPMILLAMFHMIHIELPSIINPYNGGAISFTILQLVLTTIVYIVNKDIFVNGFKSLFKGSSNMNSLIAIGTSAAYIYSIYSSIYIFSEDLTHVDLLYFESGVGILVFIRIGKYLEEKSKRKTSQAIRKLINLQPKKANLVVDGNIKEVETSTLKVGDIILVKPGKNIPRDGVVVKGETSVDEGMISGESAPVFKGIGDKVVGATVNGEGIIEVSIDTDNENTFLSNVIKLIEDAQVGKAKISRVADKVSLYFVPIVIGLSLLSGLSWIIFLSSTNLVSSPIAFSIKIAIAILVIACPCALGLATPTAIMVATGRGAKDGILIKGGEILENLNKVDTVVFDKTGTLTLGKPVVDEVYSHLYTSEELLRYSASLEVHSEHHLGRGIVDKATSLNIKILEASDVVVTPGKGIKGLVKGVEVALGTLNFLKDKGYRMSKELALDNSHYNGKTVIFVGISGEVAGFITLIDEIRKESIQVIEILHKKGVEVAMLTGDNRKTAKVIGERLGIDNVIAEVLPGEKEEKIAALQKQGRKVVMVGDGINDAPALTRAEIGIAIGSGTDIAIESADVVLIRDDIFGVVKAINLGEKTILNIKQNLFWAFFYNIIGIPIAAGILFIPFGITLSPLIAGGAMAFSSISVVLNALRLKNISI